MKYKKIDRDTRKIVVGYVKKYSGYIRQLANEREAIIEGGAKPPDGQPRGTAAGGDPTADKAIRLEALERCHRAQVVAAIDAARIEIGDDIFSDTERAKLQQAIWLSTQFMGIGYNEIREGICVSERDFYRRKSRFLNEIAKKLNI